MSGNKKTLPKAAFFWSGGKDSAYCLQKILQEKNYEISYLITTLSLPYKRITMHGIKEELLEQQAESIGIPLIKFFLSEGTNKEYEEKMNTILQNLKGEGIEIIIFGDIFLEDLREYRENQLKETGMKAIFPLWKIDTNFLVNDFINQGFESVTCCVSDAFLDESFVGQKIDKTFLQQLPKQVDACGENGEFHSFCTSAPYFSKKIEIKVGEKLYKPLPIQANSDCDLPSENKVKGFWFAELELN
ncbi:PP-loop superfamily ATP-utilizing enzyme [Bernardetia litoralis DSM 6794]|uniref:PP-loop superfamily ATP-utilizing enzyme n=1 Tax=Bernardetia litoralis (strain ATCC 23117 / DSM 6794 / NBRC 15988 / NCIMB 1366 / Fx l1 / Sio-4) TaxID=880071 RepID=I4AQW6_BERLS|nr:diphthine--ammonia ligase [Bernardetia litoralis]AFM06351.1 PP-loop superfamily ATP-utilizing enzyme [Bernardetia litoralis DSM 6794]